MLYCMSQKYRRIQVILCVHVLGLVLNYENSIKRSGANYIDSCDYTVYENYEDFLSKNEGEFYFLTRYGTKTHTDFDYSDKSRNIYLVFGRESTGIPKEILKKHLDTCLRIPTNDSIRALNLSNCVAIMVYEVLRQQNYPNLLKYDIFKGEKYLED